MKPIIKVENLSKQYIIGGAKEPYSTFRESLINAARIPLNALKRRNRDNGDNRFWALKDINFEVMPGEVVGIIGRNGAGKSTLLKILSRITEPNEGRVELYGRVGSLLEVGTGFHPELTGRENIYLNGAILGMRQGEIAKKFDEIVDFAEIEEFLETPVKRYSSGMYMRLAFAVAANLEPEILVVDEVLAVGDTEFQKKCLGKMKDVSRSGRTVLFVSHNMPAVKNLCNSVCVLHKGERSFFGDVEQGVAIYTVKSDSHKETSWVRNDKSESAPLIFSEAKITLCGRQPKLFLELDLKLSSLSKHHPAFVAVGISEASGTVLMQALPTIEGFINSDKEKHRINLKVALPPLIPGDYFVSLWTGSHNTETFDEIKECVSFRVVESPTPNRTFPHSTARGFIVPSSSYRMKG